METFFILLDMFTTTPQDTLLEIAKLQLEPQCWQTSKSHGYHSCQIGTLIDRYLDVQPCRSPGAKFTAWGWKGTVLPEATKIITK